MEKFTPGTRGVVMLGCDSPEHRLDMTEKATQALAGWFPSDTGRSVVWGWENKEEERESDVETGSYSRRLPSSLKPVSYVGWASVSLIVRWGGG